MILYTVNISIVITGFFGYVGAGCATVLTTVTLLFMNSPPPPSLVMWPAWFWDYRGTWTLNGISIYTIWHQGTIEFVSKFK